MLDEHLPMTQRAGCDWTLAPVVRVKRSYEFPDVLAKLNDVVLILVVAGSTFSRNLPFVVKNRRRNNAEVRKSFSAPHQTRSEVTRASSR